MEWLLATVGLLALGIFDTIKRWFTLPKRYNSLSDIARDPLGAIANAAQWVIPLATGLPGGFQSLPQLFSNPSLIAKWSLGNVSGNLAGLFGKQSLSKLGAKDIALLVGGLQLLGSQNRADSVAGELKGIEGQLGQLWQMNLPSYALLTAMRTAALANLPTEEQYEARLRKALETALERETQSEYQRGVRTLSAERRRAEAMNRYAEAVADYPMEYLRAVWGLPSNLALTPLQLQLQLMQQRYSDALTSQAGLAQALASIYPYLV